MTRVKSSRCSASVAKCKTEHSKARQGRPSKVSPACHDRTCGIPIYARPALHVLLGRLKAEVPSTIESRAAAHSSTRFTSQEHTAPLLEYCSDGLSAMMGRRFEAFQTIRGKSKIREDSSNRLETGPSSRPPLTTTARELLCPGGCLLPRL